MRAATAIDQGRCRRWRCVWLIWLGVLPWFLGLNLRANAVEPVPLTSVEPVVVDEKTAGAIRGALNYLATKQKPNGAWEDGKADWTTAVTAYALLAYMASGHLPGEGEHGKTVAAGMQYLAEALQADGIFLPRHGQYMYAHGVATLVLAELYGQTRSATLHPKLEKAVRVILGSQNHQGGWRYQPSPRDADISVTVVQVVALRAAKNAGLEVPQKSLDQAIAYVQSCQEPATGGFGYQPGKPAGFARTAAAIYSLQVCGRYNDPAVAQGSRFLQQELSHTRAKDNEWFSYGHFYAAPALYMIGGATWRDWYRQVRDLLLRQVQGNDDQAYWGTELDRRAVGPVHCTAVYATILAMPYHYLPLYQR